ncbi:MAG TPA: hypothetical protein VHX19_01865 [Stellaceae bacterium]|jgi:hypothetical protein|nr:hypothetical protein [Stellaceae bacterium]
MSNTRKTALVFSALLGLAMTQPLAVSFAASPNAINNQTAQLVSPSQSELGRQGVSAQTQRAPGAGIYDQYDRYRDQKGFPLPGQAQLFLPYTN